MKVYVAKRECEKADSVILGIFTNSSAAESRCEDDIHKWTDTEGEVHNKLWGHSHSVEEHEVQNYYFSDEGGQLIFY